VLPVLEYPAGHNERKDMTRIGTNRILQITTLMLLGAALVWTSGCSTAPKPRDTKSFLSESDAALAWFDSHVYGLDEQIKNSAGYIIFPKVGQFGIIFGGGQFGRGTLNNPDGSQIGWAAINTGSIGLQAGVQGFKMLIVIEDKYTLAKFMDNQLEGSANAMVVAGNDGGSALGLFDDGMAIYQGANSGLMAGVNIGLDYIRYKPRD
jgi:lipid-binding SYLF domain-containing protein